MIYNLLVGMLVGIGLVGLVIYAAIELQDPSLWFLALFLWALFYYVYFWNVPHEVVDLCDELLDQRDYNAFVAAEKYCKGYGYASHRYWQAIKSIWDRLEDRP